MNVSALNRIRKSLQMAEGRCIAQMNELTVHPRPTWEQIELGFRLADEFREIHADALEAFARRPNVFPRTMPLLLKQGALVLSETLRILDHVARNYHSRQ